MATVIVFAAGESPHPEVLGDLPEGAFVVAADGGYDIAEGLGHPVDVVIGDMDSIRTLELPPHVLVVRHPVDKDATDLELAMDMVMADNPERIVLVGGTGGRQDHEAATAALLCSPRYSPVDEIDWVSARGRAHVIRGRRLIHGDVGATISLIPMNGGVSAVTTTGLQWNLDDDHLGAGTTRGVSNRFVSPVAEIRVGSGVLLAVLPS